MSDKAKEFTFSFVKEPNGYSVIWDMDKCQDIWPIEDFKPIHVIEYAAYEKLKAENARQHKRIDILNKGWPAADILRLKDEILKWSQTVSACNIKNDQLLADLKVAVGALKQAKTDMCVTNDCLSIEHSGCLAINLAFEALSAKYGLGEV